MSIDLSRFRTARKRFAERYREDVGEQAAKVANALADEIGSAMPIDTGSFKDSWNASVVEPNLFWYDPDEHYNPVRDNPDGLRIPEIAGVVPWGSKLHVSAHSPYGPYINSEQVSRRPIPDVVFDIVMFFAEAHEAGIGIR